MPQNILRRNPASWPAAPVIVITGGNGGVGFGIAERLLFQLSSPFPSDLYDAIRLPYEANTLTSEFCTPNGLTLVIAARNAVKAHKASSTLLRKIGKRAPLVNKKEWRDARQQNVAQFLTQEASNSDDPMSEAEYRYRWLQNLKIEFVALDLSSVQSVLHCCKELDERYPYITHLILNAGGGPFLGLKWGALIWQMATDFLGALTFPAYMLERLDLITNDNLGWTWQCNVFGHFLMGKNEQARQLIPKLYASNSQEPRLIWTGSLDGTPKYYNPQDHMAIKSGYSYQSTKFEVALVAWAFNDTLKAYEESKAISKSRVRSFVVHPGVVAANMFKEIVGSFMDRMMVLIFYFARLLGSQYHLVSALKAAIAFTFISLAPFPLIHEQTRSANKETSTNPGHWTPARFGARVTRTGVEHIGVDIVDVTAEGEARGEKASWWNKQMAQESLARCNRLADAFLAASVKDDTSTLTEKVK